MVDEKNITIEAVMEDCRLFGRKLIMVREITCSLQRNEIRLRDKIVNQGAEEEAVCILYHINIGYPLLTEKAELYIPSKKIIPRNDWARKKVDTFKQVMPPQEVYEEQCYFHEFEEEGVAALYNEDIKKGLKISFDSSNLNTFTQWKMFGCKDYVLGLEPGNASVDGRISMKEKNTLQYIQPYGEAAFEVNLEIIENDDQWEMIRK